MHQASFPVFCCLCCLTASVILDVGRPVKLTASMAKLQHILSMANRFHDALLPVVSLAKPVGYTEKATDGDIISSSSDIVFNFIQYSACVIVVVICCVLFRSCYLLLLYRVVKCMQMTIIFS